MPDVYFYATPSDAELTLTLDIGYLITGVPCQANGRVDAYKVRIPDGTTSQGAVLRVTCDGYVLFEGRGIVRLDQTPPLFAYDDIHLQPVPPPPAPPPPRDPDLVPFDVCQAVYEQGDFDLSTKEGCGLYTEACCTALHEQQSPLWGHIRKEPAQNQYNGHAVDAIQLLAKAGHTDAGIYDIVWSTESPEAEPAWSFKGPPDPNLWYYPA